jgi:hypothetical protein
MPDTGAQNKSPSWGAVSQTSNPSHTLNASVLITTVCSVFAIAGGLITLTGYLLNEPRLTDWNNSGISMFPNAAACAVISGIGLLLLARKDGMARTLACLLAIVGGLTLLEHIAGLNLGIDTLLFVRAWGQRASAAPMRMGLPASTSYFIFGVALLLATSGRRLRRVASACAITLMGIASLSVVGYAFGADQLFGVSRLTGIALPTSTILAALAIGLTAALSEVGLAALPRHQDAGGLLAHDSLSGTLIALTPVFTGAALYL